MGVQNCKLSVSESSARRPDIRLRSNRCISNNSGVNNKDKELRALRAILAPLGGQDMKITYDQILLISLIEQWSKCISLVFI